MIKIIRMLKFLKTVNVLYHNEKNETVFVDRVIASDLPRIGESILRSKKAYKIISIWHNYDNDLVEIMLLRE